MGALELILGGLATLLAGLNVYQLILFRSYKAKYKAEAEKDEAEAAESKQSALERRLSALEQLYAEQGKTVDNLRIEYLKLSEEKFQSEKRIVQLEGENKALKEKVDRLEKEVKSYKTLRLDGASWESTDTLNS